jgi:hypothetical protein
MSFAFNPFTGNFDLKGSGGGGGSAFFAGEVATYADLPLDGTAALNSRWLVRSASGVWPFPGYHQGGIYVRVSTAGVDRATDYLLADTNFPDVFSDAAFTVYDDADSTRSMQIEVTDNETLTFKVTGTDSVVRSVAFALSAIVLAALMASSAIAQNIGLVTDTNGNVVTRRTNELVWSNNLRFTPLTNANSRTAIIGTNGALTAGNPPSGAAASNSILTADGAGGSTFSPSRVQFAIKQTNTVRTSWTNNSNVAANDDTDASVTLDANSIYRIEFAAEFLSNTNIATNALTLASSQNLRTITSMRSGYVANGAGGLTAIGWNSASGSAVSSSSGGAPMISFASTGFYPAGVITIYTGANAPNVFFRWWPTANTTNTNTLTTNSWIRAEKLYP